MAEGFRKARCWAMSACHVTLIDPAFAVAQAPVHPRLLFQFPPWFIYNDTRLNNHWVASGVSYDLVPSKRNLVVSVWNARKRSCCKRCSVHVRTNLTNTDSLKWNHHCYWMNQKLTVVSSSHWWLSTAISSAVIIWLKAYKKTKKQSWCDNSILNVQFFELDWTKRFKSAKWFVISTST